MTFGGRDRGVSGYLHFGRDGGGPRLYGALNYDRHNRRPYGTRCYPRGHYYHLYYPIHHFSRDYFLPWDGYRYSSLYYSDPYVYQFYDTDVYYIEEKRAPAQAVIVEGTEADRDLEVGPSPDVTYQALLDPGDSTLIGRGNAAFIGGLYDEARRYYVSAMLADERDGYAKLLYAVVNFATGDYEVAGMAIRRALLTTPELIEYPPDIRGLYTDGVPLDAQVEMLARFVDTHPLDGNARLLLAYVQLARGHPSEALAILDDAVKTDTVDELAGLLRDAIVRIQDGRSFRE